MIKYAYATDNYVLYDCIVILTGEMQSYSMCVFDEFFFFYEALKPFFNIQAFW